MKHFINRDNARLNRSAVNEKAKAAGSKATLRAPVKDKDGLWTFPGLTHGSKLSLKRN